MITNQTLFSVLFTNYEGQIDNSRRLFGLKVRKNNIENIRD